MILFFNFKHDLLHVDIILNFMQNTTTELLLQRSFIKGASGRGFASNLDILFYFVVVHMFQFNMEV